MRPCGCLRLRATRGAGSWVRRWWGGARDTFYVKDISTPSATVGCMLKPGATLALFGVAAHEISGVHTRLNDLWGTTVAQIQMRHLAASTPQQRLAVLEQTLIARLSERYRLPPAWQHWLERFDANMPVAALVRSSGLSHRHFNALFLNVVGLTPKRYARVQRSNRRYNASNSPHKRTALRLHWTRATAIRRTGAASFGRCAA